MNIQRLLIIDRCLRDKQHDWTLQDLIDACKETESNSRRSVQADLELMRSTTRGYSAPIVVVAKKYYKYSDEHYSLVKQQLTELDKKNISDALDVISKYQNFNELKGVNDSLLKLQYSVATALGLPIPFGCDGEKVQNKLQTVRLWIGEALADKVRIFPFNKTQKIESVEIDGSINIVVNLSISREFINFILLNDDNIQVHEPISLLNKIKKMKGL